MKKLLTVAAVLLPLAAAAQYEPVAPAPADSAPTYNSRRSPWYIGFGLGTGDGNVNYSGADYTFDEWHGGATSPTNAFVNFKVGATLSPTLLVGFDVSAMRSQLDEGGLMTAIQISNYDAMATWFPMGEGLFLRGGVGLTKLTLEADAGVYGSASMDVSGFNLTVGGGYALWVGQAFNLTLNLDYSVQSYGSSTTDPESSNYFAAWVGFDWY